MEEDNAVIVDFTSIKLIDMLSKERDSTRFMILEALLDAYSDGRVAILWKGGEPFFYDPKKRGSKALGIDDMSN